jgi:hypothetical protein
MRTQPYTQTNKAEKKQVPAQVLLWIWGACVLLYVLVVSLYV